MSPGKSIIAIAAIAAIAGVSAERPRHPDGFGAPRHCAVTH
jgi:hypothetical protein